MYHFQIHLRTGPDDTCHREPQSYIFDSNASNSTSISCCVSAQLNAQANQTFHFYLNDLRFILDANGLSPTFVWISLNLIKHVLKVLLTSHLRQESECYSSKVQPESMQLLCRLDTTIDGHLKTITNVLVIARRYVKPKK